MKLSLKLFLVFFLGLSISISYGRNPEKKQKVKSTFSSSRADCAQAEAQIFLEVNNVRAILLTGGDIWWDHQEGKYIVPKPAPGFPEVSSIFAGGVWIGGLDPVGNLKLAAVQYSNNGRTDWYPGPLDENGQTEAEICADWDRFFVVTGEEIKKHNSAFENADEYNCDSIPEGVKYWPGQGNPFFGEKYDFPLPNQELGNYWDENGDNRYNPCDGDFPIIDIRGCEPEDRLTAKELLPDEMIFWIYNDNGGAHTLSEAAAIQMEVQVQAFAYATNDEINDMTFYRYKLLNKAKDDIRSCYFAMWVDADLGCSDDDYIGCDVDRSLAIYYNEDAVDGNPGSSCAGGVNTYGDNIPLLGIDYFRGPRGPKVFVRDDNGNVVLNDDGKPILMDPEEGTNEQDTLVELGMTSFIYQNRQGAGTHPEPTTDPNRDNEFYNILKGRWKDGTPLTFGGTGFNPMSNDTVRYALPGKANDETTWSMCSEDLGFGDRRTVQATGPLLLQPGATNELIIGAVFVPNVDYPCPDFSRLTEADDLAQALFDNCFDIIDGPTAPDLYAVELDRQLIIMLSNDTLITETNNAKEQYHEVDFLASEVGAEDSLYRFEGYKLYQLKNPSVSVQELDNIELARLIRQVDVKNGVSKIYNWKQVPNPNPASSDKLYTYNLEVDGEDKGILHTFNITTDAFASGDDTRLVNHKDYYYTVVAYAYNNFEPFDPIQGIGQIRPYLEGRLNVHTYTLTPRPIVYDDLQSAYGTEAQITRLDGVGTSLNALDMTDDMHQKILDGSFDGAISYKAGFGPINAKVVDPLHIKDGKYRLEIVGDYDDAPSKLKLDPNAKWTLTNLTTGQVIASEKTISEINEQIIYGEGFSISVNQVGEPGELFDEDNGAIAQSISYKDPLGTAWWDAIPGVGYEIVIDEEEDRRINVFPIRTQENLVNDPKLKLTEIGPGHFIPLYEARWVTGEFVGPYFTPAWKERQGFAIQQKKLNLKDLNNVDIVLTPDKSKWSECIVIETATDDYTQLGVETIGNASQWDLRQSPSIDKDGNEIPGSTGKSYFPGYAIDVETGQRLNIFFGENSVYNTTLKEIILQQNPNFDYDPSIGGDMIWNPDGRLFLNGQNSANNILGAYAGAQQYIYVTRQPYDGCEALYDKLKQSNLLNKIDAVSLVTWTAVPLPAEDLLPLSEGLIPNEVTVKLRVTNPFGKELVLKNPSKPKPLQAIGGLPLYEFEFKGVEKKPIEKAQYSDALDNVRIVPNPYYAYSSYEKDQFSNTVKITNLPPRAIVTIYTLDGKFIQRFDRNAIPRPESGNNPAIVEGQINPSIEWNLKNVKGIPVASGVYIFHIEAPDLGVEKSIKWFGINRRFDPTGL